MRLIWCSGHQLLTVISRYAEAIAAIALVDFRHGGLIVVSPTSIILYLQLINSHRWMFAHHPRFYTRRAAAALCHHNGTEK
jgi:hypothetical protein